MDYLIFQDVQLRTDGLPFTTKQLIIDKKGHGVYNAISSSNMN